MDSSTRKGKPLTESLLPNPRKRPTHMIFNKNITWKLWRYFFLYKWCWITLIKIKNWTVPLQFSSVQFSRSVVSDSATPWISARQASLSITNSQSSPKPKSIESVMPSSHLILCCPLLLPPIPPSIRVFTRGGPGIGVSALASVLPMNTQDWSPLEWTGWISLQSKGLSRVFSNARVQKHQFFGAQLSS